MRTFVATSNAGKLNELRAIFAESVLDLETFDAYVAPNEGESSYLDNAQLKAHALHAQLREAGTPAWVLADDSGLEVDALDGRPGVLSARYAGSDATWPERRAALLKELEGHPDASRSARFVCYMALVFEDGTSIAAAGCVAGRIALQERGGCGFGYDSIFYYAPAEATFAQLSEAQKNRFSHRAIAAENLLNVLALHGA